MPVTGEKKIAETVGTVVASVSGEGSDRTAGGAPGYKIQSNGAIPRSYILRLWKSVAEKPPEAAPLCPSPEFSTTPPDSKKETLKRKLAEKLIQQNSGLQMRPLPHERIAQFEKISTEEARRKYRQVELEMPESGNGIQITLNDDEASVMLPFWHDGEKAGNAIRELWSYVEIICRETGYYIYDPQVGRSFETATGHNAVLANYTETSQRLVGPFRVNGEQIGLEGAPAQASLPLVGVGPHKGLEIRRIESSGDGGVVLVAVQETGAVSGFAEVIVNHDRAAEGLSGPVAWLKGWYVAPEFRGRGIGRRLLERAEEWAAGWFWSGGGGGARGRGKLAGI